VTQDLSLPSVGFTVMVGEIGTMSTAPDKWGNAGSAPAIRSGYAEKSAQETSAGPGTSVPSLPTNPRCIRNSSQDRGSPWSLGSSAQWTTSRQSRRATAEKWPSFSKFPSDSQITAVKTLASGAPVASSFPFGKSERASSRSLESKNARSACSTSSVMGMDGSVCGPSIQPQPVRVRPFLHMDHVQP